MKNIMKAKLAILINNVFLGLNYVDITNLYQQILHRNHFHCYYSNHQHQINNLKYHKYQIFHLILYLKYHYHKTIYYNNLMFKYQY